MFKKNILIFLFITFSFFLKAQSESDLMNGKINVPSYTEGNPREILGMFGFRYYKIYINFEDGSNGDGDLFKAKEEGTYYISTGLHDVYYKSKIGAIKALYIYKKYGKITEANKK